MKYLLLVTLFVLSVLPVSAAVPVLGCTDAGAFNYNPLADTDDGSCVPIIRGCADPKFFNYDPEVNTPDDSCFAVGSSAQLNMPLINPFVAPVITVNNQWVTVSWLTTKFMAGSVLVDDISHQFPLGEMQSPRDNLGAPILGAASYDQSFGDEVSTYHVVTFRANLGIWYVRPMASIGDYQVFGQEIKVVVQ